ncbi:MAG TPA: bifunctional phosphopantothenoylcysteine decarboxylase/phosphopantothenate--cysteine ligase CoaBC [Nevskiaceae bacterium]
MPQRILLIVTAGIAAYKAALVVRLLAKAGREIQVVTTAGVRHFVGDATFQALSTRPVRSDLWDAHAEAAMGHIELARWADAVVVAPATADFIARLAHGRADDLASTLCLASDRPLWVAPAMNRLMWNHPATQANVRLLEARGATILGPASGAQACGEVGAGRMLEPEDIAARLLQAPGVTLSGRRAVVTAGPTREALDPVRYLSNRSSGRQGFAVAQALARAGARVTLVAGPVDLPAPRGVDRIDVITAQQMLEATLDACTRGPADLLVGAAAVADYRPAQAAAQKIKKTADALTLELVRNPDILTEVRRLHPELFIVGFAAETDRLADNARSKLRAKKLDLIAANPVDHDRAFGRDDNELSLYWQGGERRLPHADKATLAQALVEVIADRLRDRDPDAGATRA